jgi:tetratricopeptide (TPR) repeat protein
VHSWNEAEITEEKSMIRGRKFFLEAVTIAGLLLAANGIAAAQGMGSGQGTQGQTPPPAGDKSKTPDVAPLTLDAPAPVSAEEEAAYKAFHDAPMSDTNKKIELGEAFLQKYPQSRYKSPVYSALTFEFLQLGQVQKMEQYGEMEIALSPNDVSTLALLGQTLPRSLHGNPPDADKVLAKSEQYSKQAIEITPTLPKPPEMTDEQFEKAKNQTLAMAHGALGLVFIRRGKNAEAIPELETSVKIDPTPDPVNYYLLGLANKSASHFDDAIAAFNKCAAIPGAMQATCKTQAEDAKKLSSTQLSTPK